MHTNITKRLEKIMVEFGKINPFAKGIIKYGMQAFLGLLALGTFLIIYNTKFLGFDLYMQFTAISIIKNSFIILAEVVIGALLIDFILKKV